MAWIPVDQALPTHRKTLHLAALLNIPRAQVVGHLVIFWAWSVDNTTDGALPRESGLIAAAAGWSGDAQAWTQALVAAGFLDDSQSHYVIHDWPDYVGRLVARRECDKLAARERRRRRHDVVTMSPEGRDNMPQKASQNDRTMSQTGEPPDSRPDMRRRRHDVVTTSSPRVEYSINPLPPSSVLSPPLPPTPPEPSEGGIPPQSFAGEPRAQEIATEKPPEKPQKTAKPRSATPTVSEEFCARMVTQYAASWPPDSVRERIATALAHRAARNYSNLELYVQGWLRRDLAAEARRGLRPAEEEREWQMR